MIRTYSLADQEELIQLMHLHVPRYFAASELEDYRNYLNKEVEDYFVYESAGQIIGAGGINYFPESRTARLSWDMVHPEAQEKGIGKTLALFRISCIQNKTGYVRIMVRTSQHAEGFYAKLGFQLSRVVQDFWAEGLDLHEMEQAIG